MNQKHAHITNEEVDRYVNLHAEETTDDSFEFFVEMHDKIENCVKCKKLVNVFSMLSNVLNTETEAVSEIAMAQIMEDDPLATVLLQNTTATVIEKFVKSLQEKTVDFKEFILGGFTVSPWMMPSPALSRGTKSGAEPGAEVACDNAREIDVRIIDVNLIKDQEFKGTFYEFELENDRPTQFTIKLPKETDDANNYEFCMLCVDDGKEMSFPIQKTRFGELAARTDALAKGKYVAVIAKLNYDRTE